MDFNRLFQCRPDSLVYIKHLELRILELESACSSHYPESLGSQQQINGQCRPCEVCRNPNLYQGLGSQEISADSIRLASESSPEDQSSSADSIRLAPESSHNNQSSSADGIRLASESSHNNQSSQHDRSPERTYAFIPYEPLVITASSVGKDSSTLTKPTQKKKDHLSLFTSSVGNLPQSSAWKNWATIDETQRKNIVFNLVSGLAFRNDDNPIASEQPVTVSIILEYGTSMEPVEMKDTSAESVAKRPFACFQELIFCSLCAVALEVNPKANVFQAMRSVFRCDAQPKTLQGRIRGAKWANRAIYLLSRTNWGSYSWDIIYVGMKHISIFPRQANF